MRFWGFALETRARASVIDPAKCTRAPLIRENLPVNFDDDPKGEKIRKFEKAVRELIEEGHSFSDHEAWLDMAAARAGVDLQEVLPTQH